MQLLACIAWCWRVWQTSPRTVWTLGAIYLKDHHRCMAALMLTPILVVLAVGLFYYPFRLSLELSVDGNFLPPLAAVSRQVQLKILGPHGVS